MTGGKFVVYQLKLFQLIATASKTAYTNTESRNKEQSADLSV